MCTFGITDNWETSHLSHHIDRFKSNDRTQRHRGCEDGIATTTLSTLTSASPSKAVLANRAALVKHKLRSKRTGRALLVQSPWNRPWHPSGTCRQRMHHTSKLTYLCFATFTKTARRFTLEWPRAGPTHPRRGVTGRWLRGAGRLRGLLRAGRILPQTDGLKEMLHIPARPRRLHNSGSRRRRATRTRVGCLPFCAHRIGIFVGTPSHRASNRPAEALVAF